MDRITEITICHEWGHALMAFAIMGGDIVDTIEIEDSFYRVNGHTALDYIKRMELTNEQNLLILYGGITAEKICEYTKSSYHRGTDWNKIRVLLPNRQDRLLYAEKALKILLPYKEALEKLTKDTIQLYPTERDNNDSIYFRLFRDEIKTMISKYPTPEKAVSAPYAGL